MVWESYLCGSVFGVADPARVQSSLNPGGISYGKFVT